MSVVHVAIYQERYPDWRDKVKSLKVAKMSGGYIVAHKYPEHRQKALDSLVRATTRKNRKKRSSAVIDFADPADCIVHVVYPTEIDALVSDVSCKIVNCVSSVVCLGCNYNLHWGSETSAAL